LGRGGLNKEAANMRLPYLQALQRRYFCRRRREIISLTP
jgi:hypothetical protein